PAATAPPADGEERGEACRSVRSVRSVRVKAAPQQGGCATRFLVSQSHHASHRPRFRFRFRAFFIRGHLRIKSPDAGYPIHASMTERANRLCSLYSRRFPETFTESSSAWLLIPRFPCPLR